MSWGPVVELRQYELVPGRREVLVELFDREFVAPQEALGLRMPGQFRDLDDPDRYVWLRGFPDLATRAERLTAFYGGPVWAAHKGTANPTMVSVENVLLLRPAGPVGDPPPGELIGIDVYPVADEAAEDAVLAALAGGSRPIADLRTLTAVNEFPRLPIREGEHVVVRVRRHGPPPPVDPALLVAPPQHLRLEPTPASALR